MSTPYQTLSAEPLVSTHHTPETETPMSSENIEVIPLGEDEAVYLVTGTTDAHSAEESVREHDRVESVSGCGYLDKDLPLGIEYRTDWAFIPHEDYDEVLVHGEASEGHDQFAGYLVTP